MTAASPEPAVPASGPGRPTGVTATGRMVWHEAPELTPVDLRDVFTHLNREYRYNGALNWTVLQHTALCVKLVAEVEREQFDGVIFEEARQYVAAHDLHEAYVGDVVTGLKRPEFRAIEEAWEAHVHRSLGLTWPLSPALAEIVRLVDRWALAAEMLCIGPPPIWECAPPAPVTPRVRRIVEDVRAYDRQHLCHLVRFALGASC